MDRKGFALYAQIKILNLKGPELQSDSALD